MSAKQAIGGPLVIGGRKRPLSRAIRAGDFVFGFNAVYGAYFPDDPPARPAVVSELLADVRVEVEVAACRLFGG